MASSFVQKLIAIIITMVLLTYWGYSLYNKSTDGVVLDESINAETTSQDVVNLVTKLKELRLDKSVFSNKYFSGLVDFTSIVIPEEQGRPNPFNPIGAENGTIQISKTQTKSKP
jgi:hypothetical protein